MKVFQVADLRGEMGDVIPVEGEVLKLREVPDLSRDCGFSQGL